MSKNETDTVEIDRETLETLTLYADQHGEEYASPDLYHAVASAKQVLGTDMERPHFVWRSSWGEKPE